ncbi:type IV secretion system protein [Citrobacter freundii]|uniref:type IV secretion system protein n=1 Tax=Citrobacter sp. RHBSTW-01013 TaxID=2742677 RepID=UPI0015EA42A0|nr:type IV secretion system protein [Citrobacter sp. RHBSTW-01013]MBA7979815.1 pilus assembly protein [Citrobacter freundii]QLR26899.1 pilus assembly protein [Citrobacter sp. RHBSTW-01013]
MKKQLLAVMLFSCSASVFAIGTGVIVHDAQSSIDTAAQWVKEAKQWQNELTAYKDELLTKTGIRDVQGLVQDAQSVSSELTQIYDQGNAFIDDYIKNPDGVLSQQAKTLLSDYKVTDTCKGLGYTGDLVKGCEASFLSQLAGVEYGNQLQDKLKEDNQSMKDLIDQVKNAKDTKATQDATNAVSLENMKFEKLKFQYEMYRDKQRDLAQYKEKMSEAAFNKKQLDAVNTENPIVDYKNEFNQQDYEMN